MLALPADGRVVSRGLAHGYFNPSSAWDRMTDRYAGGSSSFALSASQFCRFNHRQPPLAVRLVVDGLGAPVEVRVDLDDGPADRSEEAYVRLDRLKFRKLVPHRESCADRLDMGKGHVAVELLKVVGQSDTHAAAFGEPQHPFGTVKAVAGNPENELVNGRFKVLWHVVSSTPCREATSFAIWQSQQMISPKKQTLTTRAAIAAPWHRTSIPTRRTRRNSTRIAPAGGSTPAHRACRPRRCRRP